MENGLASSVMSRPDVAAMFASDEAFKNNPLKESCNGV